MVNVCRCISLAKPPLENSVCYFVPCIIEPLDLVIGEFLGQRTEMFFEFSERYCHSSWCPSRGEYKTYHLVVQVRGRQRYCLRRTVAPFCFGILAVCWSS